jgi:hypothetical protein
MRLRLIRKLADALDGVDLSAYQEGDILDLPRAEAALLLAEGWAERLDTGRRFNRPIRTVTLDAPMRFRTVEQLRRVREQMEERRLAQIERRRAEDRVREELRDGRARVIQAGVDRTA